MAKNNKPGSWEIALNLFLIVGAVILLLMIILSLLGKTVWDMPLFYLVTAVFILFESLLYLIVKRIDNVAELKKKLLIGMACVSFLILILTSGLAIVGAIMSVTYPI